MSIPSPQTDVETSIVKPGESKLFVYVGEMIPNQVLVQNLDPEKQANFIVRAVNDSRDEWGLFGVLKPGETISLLVQWPTEARFTNQAVVDSSFRVFGDGIFPKLDG